MHVLPPLQFILGSPLGIRCSLAFGFDLLLSLSLALSFSQSTVASIHFNCFYATNLFTEPKCFCVRSFWATRREPVSGIAIWNHLLEHRITGDSKAKRERKPVAFYVLIFDIYLKE